MSEGSHDGRSPGPRRRRMTVEQRAEWKSYSDAQPPRGAMVRVWLSPFNERAKVGGLEQERTGPVWVFNGDPQIGHVRTVSVVGDDRWKEL